MGEEYDPAEATASSEDEKEKEAEAKRTKRPPSKEQEEEPAIGPAFVRAEEAAALRELETTALSSSLPSSSSVAAAAASSSVVQGEEGEEEEAGEATTMNAKKRQRKKTTKARQRKRQQQKQKEVGEQVESATDVYATGIPADAGDAELAAFFGKAGVVRRDAGSGRPRIRVYRDGDGRPKGDATVSYLRRESVGLALTLLDGAELRPGCAVSVTRAVYQVKGARIPPSSSSSSSSQAQEDKKHLQARQAQAQLSWAADEGPAHVVLRGMFTQEEVAAASASTSSSSSGGVEDFVSELKADIAAEAGRHGRVLSVAVFEHNPEGVAVVKVDGAAAAERCIAAMDGRFFAGRRIRAELYDGVSDFRVAESDEQREQRIRAWQQWLDTQQQRDAEGDDDDDGGDRAANQ